MAFPQQPCFAVIAARKGTVLALLEWNLGLTLTKFPPFKANKQTQQKPHHLRRFLLEEFKHIYAAPCAFSPGSDSKALTLGHGKSPKSYRSEESSF